MKFAQWLTASQWRIAGWMLLWALFGAAFIAGMWAGVNIGEHCSCSCH